MSKKNHIVRTKKVVRKKAKTFSRGLSKTRFFKWMQRKEALNAILVDHTHLA